MANSIQNASDAELIDVAAQCFKAMNVNVGQYPSFGLISQKIGGLTKCYATKDSFLNVCRC